MKIINLTPHLIRLRTEANNDVAEALPSDIVIQPSNSGPARVTAVPGAAEGSINGVALYGATQFGAVEGLPDPQPDTIYIVSALVGGQISGRTDVVQPGTGPADGPVRDAGGQVFAVTRLIRSC